MDELNSLKAKFMTLQKQSSSFKLSERTVVEIINKIANRGKVHLLHTVTGKEYVVDEKVNFEIQNEIKKQKKVSIIELSKSLELPINVIEKKVQNILAKNKNLTFVEGKILTKDFLNQITVDIKNILNHFSSATIGELSDKYELNSDFMKKFLKEKIDNGIKDETKDFLENAINKVNADLGLLVIVSDAYLNNKIICKRKDKRPFIISEDVRKQLIDSLNNEFPNIQYGGVELGGESPSTVKTLKRIPTLKRITQKSKIIRIYVYDLKRRFFYESVSW